MQKITKILMVDGSIGNWTDEFGKKDSTPEIVVGVQAVLRFDLRQISADSETGVINPVSLEDFQSDSYYIALDSDYLQDTDPKLLKNTGISVTREDGHVYLDAQLPNTAVPGLMDAVGSGEKVTLNGEVGGFSGDGDSASADFAFQFQLIIRNRVYLGGEVPPDVQNDPEYLKAHEVIALIEQATRPEQGEPGLSAYQLAVENGYTGSEAEWLESLQGAAGDDGLSAYLLAVENGYTGTLVEWMESLRGEVGGDGKSAYQLAVENGYTGSEAEWLESLRGAPGQDLKFDAVGELSERGVYDDEPAGFVFGATETNYEERWSKLYIYVKASGEHNDWHTPVVVTLFKGRDGIDGENIALIPPLEFEAPNPDNNYEYLTFSLHDYPAATIAAVCIDTAEGELRLPYDSALGILKIVKDSEDTVRVYFGTLCPAFETGRVYFAQGGTTRNNYQIWLGNGHDGTESDYLEWLRAESNEYTFDETEVTDRKLTIPGTGAVVAVIDETGRQYPFALDEVVYNTEADTTEISLAAIMTYRNLAAIPGTWKIVFAVGKKGDNGVDGQSFVPDARGTLAERDQYDGEAKGFSYLDVNAGTIYHKLSGDTADWSDGFAYLPGPQGPSGTISVGTVSSGETASVTNSGTPEAAVFNFVLPKGDKGEQGIQGFITAVISDVLPENPEEGMIWVNSGD